MLFGLYILVSVHWGKPRQKRKQEAMEECCLLTGLLPWLTHSTFSITNPRSLLKGHTAHSEWGPSSVINQENALHNSVIHQAGGGNSSVETPSSQMTLPVSSWPKAASLLTEPFCRPQGSFFCVLWFWQCWTSNLGHHTCNARALPLKTLLLSWYLFIFEIRS